MHILIASDSFKGCLSSLEVAQCIQTGIARILPDAQITTLPVADGGEGTMDAVVAALGGRYRSLQVMGPMGQPVDAKYGLLPDGSAVIEMAQASGLPLVPLDQRNPYVATTYGTGQLIADAMEQGCRRILIGIGGSATNDGGSGMASALGVRFLDTKGEPLSPGGAALKYLETIDITNLDPRLSETEILVASDVTNPLCGPSGASVVYGPQKGCDAAMVETLDHALAHYGIKVEETFGRDFSKLPGAGAAGGLGAGLMAFCHGELHPGVDIVFSLLHMEKRVQQADLIITGEGRIDATSVNGKLISGIAALTSKYNKPLIAFTGSQGPGFESVYNIGVQAIIPIPDAPLSLESSLFEASKLITNAAERTARLLQLGEHL